MKTQSCKSKGRRLQQKVVADVLAAFPHLQPDDVRSTSMGCGGEDVQLSSAARRAFPFSVECKNTEKLALWSALEQCQANCRAPDTPLVIFKRNRSPTYAALPWETLLALITAARAQQTDASSPSPSPGCKRPRSVPDDGGCQKREDDCTQIERLQHTCDRILEAVMTTSGQ